MGYRYHRRRQRDDPRRRRVSRREREDDHPSLEGLGGLIGDAIWEGFAALFRLMGLGLRRLLNPPKANVPPPATGPWPTPAYPPAPAAHENPQREGESYEAGVARIASGSPYRKVDGVLTKGERAFWFPLQQAIGGKYLILCKVSLADLIADSRWDGRLRKFAGSHADFVLCHPQTTAPLLVIELDDCSHRTSRSVNRDRRKDEALRAARLPVYRVRCQQAYAPDEIAEAVARLVG